MTVRRLYGEMSYHSKELTEHIPYVPPLALHGFSMDSSGAHYKDALRLGLPIHLDAAYFDPVHGQRSPYRRLSYFPFHVPLGVCDYSFEPAFIRKRNERERHRVRCVNEGYARLREHLPQEFEDKRLSKVETLRAAIDYIKHLQSLLDLNASGMEMPLGDARNRAPLPQRTDCNSDGESKTGLNDSGGIVY
ncbi:achaete-scute homolog 4-like [Anarhichas minor]|uniref:achaete-scute homolog 4-like n=1 Tax=Anarhichas minor TaxID=65739 RepID=UPI003F732A8B